MANNKKKRGHRPKPLKNKASSSSTASPAAGAPPLPPSPPPSSASQPLPRNPGSQSQIRRNYYHRHHQQQAPAAPLTDAEFDKMIDDEVDAMTDEEIFRLFANAGIDTSPRKMARLARIPGLGLPDPPPRRRPPHPTHAMKRRHFHHNVQELCNKLADFCVTADDVDARVGIQMEPPGPSGADLILWKQAYGVPANAKTAQEVAEEQRIEEAFQQMQQEKDGATTNTNKTNTSNNQSQAPASLKDIDRMLATTMARFAAASQPQQPQPQYESSILITRADVAKWAQDAPQFGVRDDYMAAFYRDGPAQTAEDVMQNSEVTRMRLMHLDKSTDMAMEVLQRRNVEMARAIEDMRALRLGDGESEGEGEGEGSNEEAMSESHGEAPADGLRAEVSSAGDDSGYGQAEAQEELIDDKGVQGATARQSAV